MLARASFWALLAISLNVAVHVQAAPATGTSVSSTDTPSSTITSRSEPTTVTSSTTTSSPPPPPPSSTSKSTSPTESSSTSPHVVPSSTSHSASPPAPPSTPSPSPPPPSPPPPSPLPSTTSSSTSSSSSASTSSTSSASQSTTSGAPPPVNSTVPLVPPGNGKKNPKRGLGYAGSVPGDVINANQTNSVISWLYNWASVSPDYLATSNIPYIPMQWGSVGASDFENEVETQSATTILTFNEPDFVNEANMDPVAAAGIWMQYIQPLKAKGVRLGGPAVTASSTGQPWLASFLAACTNCTIDFLPLHWYGEGVEGFYSYIFQVHATYPQYPIWITEFADTSGNDTEVASFLNSTITTLDTLDWIERYAWFGYFRTREGIDYNFLDENGALTPLGEVYLGASTIHTEALPSGPAASQTVDGADIPGQAAPTSWPSLSGATRTLMTGSSGALAIAAVISTCFLVQVGL